MDEKQLTGFPESDLEKECVKCGAISVYFSQEDFDKAPNYCMVCDPNIKDLSLQ